MRYLTFILVFIVVSTGILSCGSADPADLSEQQDIVIIGGDTLGKNWDNLASKEEVEQARELGITPEQYIQMKEQMQQQELEQRLNNQNIMEEGAMPADEDLYEGTTFSDQMYREQTQTVLTPDGREVVVGSNKKY